MKKLLTALKRQNGFTLVELMVVVAIIGLLSAVAIPNFKKYQAKSKLTEAKLQLSALYTAEATFFSDYNMYGGCLRYMGYDPRTEISSRYFATGFSAGVTAIATAAVSAAVNSGLKTGATDCDVTNAVASNWQYFLAGKGIGATVANAVAEMTGNAAGAAMGSAATINSTQGEYGVSVNDQSTTTNMAWQAAAVGYISGDFVTSATSAGLNINERKIIKTAVQGY